MVIGFSELIFGGLDLGLLNKKFVIHLFMKKLSFRTPMNTSNYPDGFIVYYLENDGVNEGVIRTSMTLKQKIIPSHLRERYIENFGTGIRNTTTEQINNFIETII